MKHRIYHIFAAGLACCGMAAALTACSNDDYLGGHYVTDGAGALMTVTAQISASTDAALAWNENDVIGISTGYGMSDATARNRQYVCQSDKMTFAVAEGYPIYVKGATNIVAYYPFVGTDGAEPTLTLDTRNQSAVTEYLFAKAEGVNPENGDNVHLVFDYALARVNIHITVPAGETIKSCRLSGFAMQATVDPYTLDLELNAPEDLVITGDAITSFSAKLIPQTIAADAAVPARLVLVGTIRSYTIDMSQMPLQGGADVQANIDVTDAVGTVDFVSGGSAWQDSGIGGNVTANK